MTRSMTPAGAVARGLLAGAAGTAAMTAWQELSAKLRSSGDDASGGASEQPQDPWEQAPVPAQVARRIGEAVLRRELPAERIPVLTNAMHWAYGIGWGAVYGIVAGSSAKRRPLLFGAAVWAASYAQLVPLGLYAPPWTYPPAELALDVSYHLVYGAGTGAGFALVTRGARASRR